jgi:hypothetical protein
MDGERIYDLVCGAIIVLSLIVVICYLILGE